MKQKTSYLLDSKNAKRFTSNISHETALSVVVLWWRQSEIVVGSGELAVVVAKW